MEECAVCGNHRMELLWDLFQILFAEELIYLTLQFLLSLLYLFQMIHAIDNPLVREFANDAVGFSMVFSVLLACFLHHIWLLTFPSKLVVLGIGSLLWYCWRSR